MTDVRTRPRILLVEDDPAVRRALQLSLTAEGYDVRSYGSGTSLDRDPEALAAVCLVADLVMPGIDALTLLSNLRHAGWEGKAILITGHPAQDWARRAGECGYARVMAKPIAEKALAGEIARLLEPS